jgi:hypothetical protein
VLGGSVAAIATTGGAAVDGVGVRLTSEVPFVPFAFGATDFRFFFFFFFGAVDGDASDAASALSGAIDSGAAIDAGATSAAVATSLGGGVGVTLAGAAESVVFFERLLIGPRLDLSNSPPPVPDNMPASPQFRHVVRKGYAPECSGPSLQRSLPRAIRVRARSR